MVPPPTDGGRGLGDRMVIGCGWLPTLMDMLVGVAGTDCDCGGGVSGGGGGGGGVPAPAPSACAGSCGWANLHDQRFVLHLPCSQSRHTGRSLPALDCFGDGVGPGLVAAGVDLCPICRQRVKSVSP